jgi:hypothetical protein
VLSFPENWDGGELWVREGDYEDFRAAVCRPDGHCNPGCSLGRLEHLGFVRLAAARGVLRVPEGTLVALIVAQAARDEDLLPLLDLRPDALDIVYMRGTKVTDAGLAHLAALQELRQLDLSETNVTDAGLTHLANLRQLRWLLLGKTHVTDAGLAHLANLRELQTLDLYGTDVRGPGLTSLAGLRELRDVDVGGTYAGNSSHEWEGLLERLMPHCGFWH